MKLCKFHQIEATIHPERLDAYRQDGADENLTLARYALNMALSEALYPTLQIAEIALRNAIHSSLSNRFGTDEWYDINFGYLDWQRNKIQSSKQTLQKNHKPISSGRVIAELNFGFWTAFFNKSYERTGLSHYLAKSVFSHAKKNQRKTNDLDKRWQQVRELRNRVFHHERIIHWIDLDAQHQSILELITWISPSLSQYAIMVDRFSNLRDVGLDPWINKVKEL